MDSPFFDGHFQVALVDRNEEVQALSAQASTQTLAYGVGFGRPYRCSQYSYTHSLHASVQVLGKDAIPVVDHESIGMIVRKGSVAKTAEFRNPAQVSSPGDFIPRSVQGSH